MGKLMPAAHARNEPVIVSLTINPEDTNKTTDGSVGSFTAVWGYGSKGLTLDMGKCVLKR